MRAALHGLGTWLVERFSEAPDPSVSADRSLPAWTVPHAPAAEADGARGRRERGRRAVDLELVQRRAAWKAEACRWAAAESRGDASEEHRQREHELHERRKALEECFPWMLRRPYEPEILECVADGYDNVASAAGVVAELDRLGVLEPSPAPGLLYALAEVQSALLAALARVDVRSDADQRDLFLWLKDQTTLHRIYVDRHMRLEDPADFEDAVGIAQRVRASADEARARHTRRRRRQDLLKKVDYHASRVLSAADPCAHEWASLAAAVEQWLGDGLSLDDPELRRRFGRNLRERAGADDLPEGLRPLLGPIEGRAGARNVRPETLERVAELLAGRVVTLLSEVDPGPLAHDLRRRFGLADLRWIAVEREDDLGPSLEAAVAAEDVDLVLIAVRLPAATYASFRRLCQERQRPFVRLPRGFEPDEVAYHVQRQVARRLRGGNLPAAALGSDRTG